MAASSIVVNFFLVALFATAAAQLTLSTCSIGVGLSSWHYTLDSRDTNFQIFCADGNAWKQRGITGPVAGVHTVTLRSLGRGIRRQGFLVSGRFDTPVQLVSACIADSGVVGDSTWGVLKPGNVCRGNQWTSRLGSPKFIQSLDESGTQLKGWQVKNPPRPTSFWSITANTDFVAGAVGGDGLVACNFYYGISGTLNWGHGLGQALPASESGLASYMGWYSVSASTLTFPTTTSPTYQNRACWPLYWTFGTATGPSPLVVPPSEIGGPVLLPSTQSYGSLDAVVQSFMTKVFSSLWNAEEPVHSTIKNAAAPDRMSIGFPVVMYANFPAASSDNGLGFQLGCDPSEVDETKWVYLTFWTGTSLSRTDAIHYEYFCYPDFRSAVGAANDNWGSRAGCVFSGPASATKLFPAGAPTTPINMVLKVTCQNVETRTPTPLKWPVTEIIPSAFVPNSYTIVVEQCERRCEDLDFQVALIRELERFALLDQRDGVKVVIECFRSPQCTETLDTIYLNSRRGLKQEIIYATSIPYLMRVLISTRTLTTANYVMNAIRAGTLTQYGISAFSSLALIYTNPAGKRTSLTVVPYTAANRISTWPNIGLAEWTGRCYIYGPCREGGCSSGCSNGQIVRTTAYSAGDIFCMCNACAWSKLKHRTQYLFYSDKCVNSPTVADATTCCRNIMQDAICWLVAEPELLSSDYDSLSEGLWAFRPPNIGSAEPSKLRYDGPTSCSSGSSSPKGLLGLLGLLGIIPCCLCLLSLLLCCLRRKKREGDVHFATFDAGASCAPACAPVSVCAPVCAAPSFQPMSCQ